MELNPQHQEVADAARMKIMSLINRSQLVLVEVVVEEPITI